MKSEGKGSKQPIRDSFGNWSNAKIVLLALFGAAAGQGVVWYTGQFYALFFLTTTLKLDWKTAYIIVAVALALGTGLFVFFGWLSDKIGRKRIMMAGCLLGALTLLPASTRAMTHAANPALERSRRPRRSRDGERLPDAPVPDPEDGLHRLRQGAGPAGEAQPVVRHASRAPRAPSRSRTINGVDDRRRRRAEAGRDAEGLGYPAKANPADVNMPLLILLVFIQVIFVTMVYGPIAAFLVELFPARIRYTSMSLPYHIGNGWFGGMLPLTAAALVAAKGHIYAGLWYPVIVSAITFVIGMLFIRETRDHRIDVL